MMLFLGENRKGSSKNHREISLQRLKRFDAFGPQAHNHNIDMNFTVVVVDGAEGS